MAEGDGGYLVEGTVSLRDLDRELGLDFPLDGARTLNGLVMEHLEAMPEAGVTIKIAGCPFSTGQIADRKVRTARIRPGVGK